MRIGIIGAGMIGSALAKLWVDAGHEVRLASRHSENLKPFVDNLGRRASAGMPLAGDDKDALETAAKLVRDAGFDPVIVGPLARGKEFEPGTAPYNTGKSGPELRKVI